MNASKFSGFDLEVIEAATQASITVPEENKIYVIADFDGFGHRRTVIWDGTAFVPFSQPYLPVFRMPVDALANVNVLAPGVNMLWQAPTIDELAVAFTTTSVTIDPGVYMMSASFHSVSAANRGKVETRFSVGGVLEGPTAAQTFPFTTGGGIECSNFLQYLKFVAVQTTFTVNCTRVGAAGNMPTSIDEGEWAIIKLS